jgi:hypothetical protein
MANTKMISIKALDRIANECTDNVSVDWHGEQLVIDKLLTFGEMALFADKVVEVCFDKETGAYHPEARDYADRLMTVVFYTNVRLPEENEHRYKLLYKTDLYRVILEHVNPEQYDEMMAAISRKISHELHLNKRFLETKVEAAANDVARVVDAVSELFEGVEPGDIQNIAKAIGDGYSEEKLIQAVLNKDIAKE